jgi:ribosome-associated protein
MDARCGSPTPALCVVTRSPGTTDRIRRTSGEAVRRTARMRVRAKITTLQTDTLSHQPAYVVTARFGEVRHAGPVPGDLHVRPSVVIPEGELRWRFSRSSGPGGQSVNTTDSRAELSWDLATSSALSPVQRERALERLSGRLVDGVLTIAASEHRSQLRNRTAAESRLSALVADAIGPPPRRRRPTRPSKGAVDRRIAEKKRRGNIKRLRRPDDS